MMANPKTPQQNPRISFEQKVFSKPSFPSFPTSPTPKPRPLKTSPNSTLHNPPPQLSSSSFSAQSSSSYSSAPSSPSSPSNLTSKMRNLWNISHSKSFLSNLNMGIAANFPLKNLNLHSKKNVPIVYADEGAEIGAGFGREEYHEYIIHANHTNNFDHSDQMNDSPAATPIPKSSSPNGKPAKPLAYCAAGDLDTNLLSGPSTQHTEYLLSRVEGQFMSPDTPPMDSPLGERFGRGLLFGSASGRYDNDPIKKGTYENENEIEGVGDMRSTGDRNQEGVESRSGRGRAKMIPKKQNQKTWKSIHRSCREMLDGMNLLKCDSEGTKAMGQENGNRFVGAVSYMDIVNDEDDDEGNETEHDDDTENYDECDVFTDAHSGSGSGKYWENDQDRHRLIHTESQDSMVEIYTSSPSSSDRDTKLGSQNQANIQTDIEETIDESILTPRKPLRESDFAYMHMRPKPKTNPQTATGNPFNTMSENGNENGNTYRYRYPNHNDDDKEDTQSSLDMEDSLYDDTENPTPKFKLHMARAEAEYPDFATMMDRDRDMNTDTYPSTPTPNPQTQIQNATSWSHKREFDADAALDASLSSLSRLQYEYQLQCLSGSQGSIAT
ncbi:uncharacterized protein EAE97_002733 [Botrytis byssoidea]|uniref:Uncharacterized protein n=1 Tax=Botrytis byssoidea TaxID=139641 RepID=A0A9P5LXX4_9HELO|nr:uncharacterized protein EAE97_002733 [Botrytis byssoidea]KAF7951182.1 hypothetical protein EAE97_002733 [Botrytis byssoidea]